MHKDKNLLFMFIRMYYYCETKVNDISVDFRIFRLIFQNKCK